MRSMMPRIRGGSSRGYEPACGPGDVAHQAGGELDLVQDPQDREQRRAGRTPSAAGARTAGTPAARRGRPGPRSPRAPRRSARRARGRRRGAPGWRRRSARRSWPRASRPRCGSPASCSSNVRRVSGTGASPFGVHRRRVCPQHASAARLGAGAVHRSFTRRPPAPYGSRQAPSLPWPLRKRGGDTVRAAMLGFDAACSEKVDVSAADSAPGERMPTPTDRTVNVDPTRATERDAPSPSRDEVVVRGRATSRSATAARSRSRASRCDVARHASPR